jgi:hypothetical protein
LTEPERLVYCRQAQRATAIIATADGQVRVVRPPAAWPGALSPVITKSIILSANSAMNYGEGPLEAWNHAEAASGKSVTFGKFNT